MQRLLMMVIAVLMFNPAVQAATIQLPATGQTKCYQTVSPYAEISCAGTGQDGDKLMGVASPFPRFTDNANGTVTDNLSGLIWLKNANCIDTVGGIAKPSGYLTWANALTWSNSLASMSCGLTDGSVAGDWRLPNINELESLVDLSQQNPALPIGHPFSNAKLSLYWSASTLAGYTDVAWSVGISYGDFINYLKTNQFYVWPVRGGQ